ncbi:MAG: hypothetical protein HQK62_11825 [Desulfamplus sp.]|nr:hypothetical protein [Desulfamplus sp.]
MGKGRRLKGLRKLENSLEEQFSEKLTINFQKELCNSPLWDQMVAEFGEKRAEEFLKECKGELKAGS